jgi:glycosyltransferase involved in cell wall biosynthesis
MPAVSVIIATYNQAYYLRRALESLFKQTYCDFEVVIIDDGSTDNTKEIIKPFSRKVRYIYQENKGRGAARQRGTDESRGEYVAFLDSDDEWFPEKLEKQMDYVKKNNFTGLLHTRVIIVDKNGKELKKENNSLNRLYGYLIKNGFTYVNFLYRCTLFLSTVILPKKLVLHAGGFRRDYRVLEDFDFLLRLVRLSRVELLNEPLAYYRHHPQNAWQAARREVQKMYLLIFAEQLLNLSDITNLRERRKAERYIYDALINFSYDMKDKNMAFRYMKEFIKKRPLGILRIKQFKNLLKLFG